MTAWDFLSEVLHYIAGPELVNNILLIVILVIVVMTLLQRSKLPFHPWTLIARSLGRAINYEVIKQQEEIRVDLDTVRKDINKKDAAIHQELKSLTENCSADKAERWRWQIVKFADEVRIGARHSEEGYNEILTSITKYKQYCEEHPKFPNSKATASIKLIEEIYNKCLQENDFI